MVIHRLRGALILSVGAVSCLAVVAAGSYGLRINLTPSYPRGLWRLVDSAGDYNAGDIVFICPPATAFFELAKQRGYLPWGTCPGGTAPLIKKIAAVAGQWIDIGTSVRIDGTEVLNTSVLEADAAGSALPRSRGGVVPPGQVFLLAPHLYSFDSRYFGPVPASGILGAAVPLLVHAR